MNYLLLGLSVLFGTGKNIVSKQLGDRFSGFINLFKINIVTALIGMAVFCGGFDFQIFKNPAALILALLYGIFTMLSQMFFIIATRHSQTAVCSLIYSMGFIMPTLFSVFFLKESFGLQKGIALGLMIISFVLVSNIKKGKGNRIYFAFLAMLSSGIIGIIQKLIGMVEGEISVSSYMFLAFAVMLVISFVGFKFKKSSFKLSEIAFRFAVNACLMGVCVSFANSINTRLAGVMPAVIFFTCVNGGVIILSAVFSRLLFGEKLNTKQLSGICIGVTAIVTMVV